MALPKNAFAGLLKQVCNRNYSLFVLQPRVQTYCSKADDAASTVRPSTHTHFDEKILEILVCPLTKQPLRFDKENMELISDTIGVAYPIINGIPNLVPQDGRVLKKKELK